MNLHFPDYTKAISELRPEATHYAFNYDLKEFESWNHDDISQPSIEEIDAAIEAQKPLYVMAKLRELRDEKLAQSDWMAVSDRTMTQAQIDYRQALRDLPQTADPQLDENGQLTNVTWPSYE